MSDVYDHPELQAAIEEELDAQAPSVQALLTQLLATTKEQLRIAQHSVAGFAPLEEDGSVIRAINVQVSGSLEKLARNPASAKWTATDPYALYPEGLSDEERETKFPGGKGLVAAARLTSVDNRFPCAIAIDVDGLVGGKNTTAGNGTSHHFIVKGNSSVDVPVSLAGYNSEAAQKLMQRYPGYTPSNLATHGFMSDLNKPGIKNIHKNHPATSVLATALMNSGAEGAAAFSQLMAAISTPELEYVEFPAKEVDEAIARANEIYTKAFNTIDLKRPSFSITRPGLPFNSTDELSALPEHYLLASLNMNSSVARDIKPAASVSSSSSSSTLLGHLAAKGSPALTTSTANLAASSVDSQSAATAAQLLKTPYSINFTFEVVYRSPTL